MRGFGLVLWVKNASVSITSICYSWKNIPYASKFIQPENNILILVGKFLQFSPTSWIFPCIFHVKIPYLGMDRKAWKFSRGCDRIKVEFILYKNRKAMV